MITDILSAIASLAPRAFRVLRMRQFLAFARPAFFLQLPLSVVQAQGPCPMPATIELRVLLEGPLDSLTGLMNDDLRAAGLIPLTEPYTALGYAHRGGGGGEVTTATMFETTGNDAIVDWVLVEVRYANDPGRLLLSRSALIQRDGDVVDAEGSNLLSLCVAPGLWHLAVRHRNHLGIMTGRPVEFFSGQFGLVFADPVDLSSPSTLTYRDGTSRRRSGGRMAMWNGDVTFDGKVKYTGSGNDRDPVLLQIGSTTPNNLDSGYVQSDVNLDAVAKYTGNGNDRDALLRTVGGTTPNNVREGYIPKDSLTLRPNVHVVDPLAWVLDTTLSDLDNGNVLVFQVNTDMEGIDTGHVVIGGEYGGYLRRVVQVDSSGSTLTLVTEPGNLYDVFASGAISITTSIQTMADPFAGNHAPGAQGGVDIVFPGSGCVQGGLEDMDVSLNGTLHQEGEFTETPLGDVCSWAFNGTMHMNGKLTLGIGFCAAPIDVEMDLIPPIPFEAGIPVPVAPGVIVIVPVTGTFAVHGIAGFEIVSGSSFSTDNEFNLDIHGRVGVDFDHGIPRPISDMSLVSPGFQQVDQVFPSNNLECEFTGGIKFGVELYNIAGPYVAFVGSHSLGVTVSQTTNNKDFQYTNAYKLIPGLEAELWEKFDVNFEIESPAVAEYTWPGKLELISDSVMIGPEEEELDDPIRVRVSGRLEILGMDIPMPPASNVPVEFNVLSGGGSILEEGTPVLTDAFGIAEAHWTLGTQTEGDQLAQARVLTGALEDIEDFSPLELHAEIEDLRLEVVSGDEQIGSVNSELLNPLVVRVLNQLDEPVEAFPVHFEVVAGAGSVSEDFVNTSSEGLASTLFTLGSDAAAQHKVKAYALNLSGDTIEDAPQYFKAFIDPDTMMYAQLSGNYQTGPASTVLPVDLRVQVRSLLGQEAREDVLVYFQVVSGGGSVSAFGTSTNSEGIASVAWTLGPDLSIDQEVIAWALDVYGDTLRGGPLLFTANQPPVYTCSMSYEMITIGDQTGTGTALVHVNADIGFIPEVLSVHFEDEGTYEGVQVPMDPASSMLDPDGNAQSTHTFFSGSAACRAVAAYVVRLNGDTVCGALTSVQSNDPAGFAALVPYTDPSAECYEMYAPCYPPPCEFPGSGYCHPGGTGQTAPPNSPLAFPIKVVATDASGQALPNYPVCAVPDPTFGEPGSNGHTVPEYTLTDAQGVATFQWISGHGGPHQQLVLYALPNKGIPSSFNTNTVLIQANSCTSYPGEAGCP